MKDSVMSILVQKFDPLYKQLYKFRTLKTNRK